MKTLVIAEKPDMGRNIAAAIEPKAANKRTHLEGETYIITWAIGHLITLAEPDKYDDKYKKWKMADLPIIPDRFKLIPVYRTRDQLKVIGELAKQCDRIVNACDAGREGQLIFAYIQQHLKLRQPVDRLWISDLTAETIRRGFRELKSGADYDNLTSAARARSEADWLIGMNGSRAFTVKHNVLLSVGRVQTPVLALIYDRQKQIEAFSSTKFYEVEAFFLQGETRYRGLWQGDRLTEADKAKALASKVGGKPGRIASYERKETKEYPFKLYDLTLLQREANAKLGFSAKKTLDVAQALYEKHKVISYPRTNSNYVTEENIPEMHQSLQMLKGTAYGELAAGADPSRVHKNNKAVCNPAKVEDHHAILPTRKKPGALSPDEQKVYDLVVRRFLAHFYPPAEYKIHTVLTEVEGERFKTTIKERLALGWKVIYAGEENAKAKSTKARKEKEGEAEADEEEETDSPFQLDSGAPVHCSEANAREKETQPPKSFTEGTLLRAMESAGKQVEDEELRDAMKDSGLGTPATRAATIERLKQVGYIDMQGKRIQITAKGRMAIELIRGAGVDLLASPEMTGHWERRLNEIARGQADSGAFMEKVKQFARLIVDKASAQAAADKALFGETAEAGRPGGRRGTRAAGGRAASGGTRGESGAARGVGPATAPRRAGAGSGEAGNAAGAASGGTRGGATAATARRVSSGEAQGATAAPRELPRADKPSSAASAAPDDSERAYVARCPRPGCGGQLFMGRKGYGCSRYKDGCGFVIWKDSFGKKLSDSMVRQLAEKGSTGKLKFTEPDGGSYEARLVLLDPVKGSLNLEKIQ
ncbi:DNA topoisomerase 3 [Gorillibacterium sp. CAU 1737]|uniref:type IA DNA topoisomerase n=1 Tax=Gorillibacterium sp. CAU 1737 TaxID=3140362 RepID=UPI00325FF32C